MELCMMVVKNARAPNIKINPKFAQFVICDTQINQEVSKDEFHSDQN